MLFPPDARPWWRVGGQFVSRSALEPEAAETTSVCLRDTWLSVAEEWKSGA